MTFPPLHKISLNCKTFPRLEITFQISKIFSRFSITMGTLLQLNSDAFPRHGKHHHNQMLNLCKASFPWLQHKHCERMLNSTSNWQLIRSQIALLQNFVTCVVARLFWYSTTPALMTVISLHWIIWIWHVYFVTDGRVRSIKNLSAGDRSIWITLGQRCMQREWESFKEFFKFGISPNWTWRKVHS